MDARFSFQVDPARDFVRITMAGLFSPRDTADFVEARRQAHRQLQCAPNAHVTLNDVRGLKIQPQETVAAFREMLAAPDYRSRRLAFVAGQTLARNQLLRALGGREARCFDDPIQAEAWLFRSDAAAARRAAAG
ncbi:MAG TPA: hypothetical protein VH331_08150 [Allosphingosinicella sp.]|jgi:hypothetical protein|nr:hypothetical protein [Allosphingosinicella sp.]